MLFDLAKARWLDSPSRALGAHLNNNSTNLLNPSADPLCPLCKEEPQTIEH